MRPRRSSANTSVASDDHSPKSQGLRRRRLHSIDGDLDSRMSRRSVYGAVAVILILGAALSLTALRDRNAAGTPPSPSVPASATMSL